MKKRAQSIMEYVLLVSIISLAFMAMQIYFRRSISACLEDLRQEYSPRR